MPSRIAIAALLAIVAATLAPAPAQADLAPFDPKLKAHVERLPLEPSVVIVPRTAGATALERYRAPRAPGPYPAHQPLVMLIRVAPAGSADTVTVTRSEREARTIIVNYEVRRFTGPLSANVVTTPLIEVELRDLSPGAYPVRVTETIREFSKYDHPETAGAGHRGMSFQTTLTVK
jgi:hypothetical protein